jgi:hypothetical protein
MPATFERYAGGVVDDLQLGAHLPVHVAGARVVDEARREAEVIEGQVRPGTVEREANAAIVVADAEHVGRPPRVREGHAVRDARETLVAASLKRELEVAGNVGGDVLRQSSEPSP